MRRLPPLLRSCGWRVTGVQSAAESHWWSKCACWFTHILHFGNAGGAIVSLRPGDGCPFGPLLKAKRQGGHMRASRILTMMALLLVLVSVGCGPSAPTVKVTKELNESSARELIKDRLSKETYKIPVDNITRLFARTLTDYKTVNAAAGPVADLKRLLDKGLVLQAADSVSYPKISGPFVFRGEGDWTQGWHLETVPNSNSVTGEFFPAGPPALYGSERSGARGTVQPDGKIELHVEAKGLTWICTYAEKGSDAYLVVQSAPADNMVGNRYKGSATGKRVDVKWYIYSWSPDFQKQFVHTQSGTSVIGGGWEVGEVSGLRLVTDTEATAKFAWKASLNDIGKLFFPSQTPHGEFQPTFGKKPDGTWFVDRLGVND